MPAAIHCKKRSLGINNEDTKAQIPIIKKIAKKLKLRIIDVYAALESQDDLIPNTVHASTGGATLIAKAVTATLAAKKSNQVELNDLKVAPLIQASL